VPIRGGHSTQTIGDALIKTFAALLPALRRTPTWDHSNEMFHHERIELATGLSGYFADPHSPSRRRVGQPLSGRNPVVAQRRGGVHPVP
jgi:IS30 family transposase